MNLANFLWNGTSLFHVDFEDSGRRDLAVELADLVEHLGSRRTPEAAWDDLLAGCDLDRSRRTRHAAARRLFAAFWLRLLLPGAPAHARNPPGTLERQSERVLALLG
jgi:thiamine kinase-like enzyme